MNKFNISKSEIKEAIFYSHYKAMKDEIGCSSKLDDLKNEDFRNIQPYFMNKSLENTRLAFRIRTKLVKNVPGNFKNMYKNNKEGLKCSHCSEDILTQSHCVICPGMGELRDGLDMENINELVTFFRRLMKKRSNK